jgi:hypothetical protein
MLYNNHWPGGRSGRHGSARLCKGGPVSDDMHPVTGEWLGPSGSFADSRADSGPHQGLGAAGPARAIWKAQPRVGRGHKGTAAFTCLTAVPRRFPAAAEPDCCGRDRWFYASRTGHDETWVPDRLPSPGLGNPQSATATSLVPTADGLAAAPARQGSYRPASSRNCPPASI